MTLKKICLSFFCIFIIQIGTAYAQYNGSQHVCSGLYASNSGNIQSQIPYGNMASSVRYISHYTANNSLQFIINYKDGSQETITLDSYRRMNNGDGHYRVAYMNGQPSTGMVARVSMYSDGSGSIKILPDRYNSNSIVLGIPQDTIIAIDLSRYY